MTSTTLELTDALGYALDDLVVHTAASGTTSTAVITALIHGAPTNVSTTRFDGRYLYNRESNRQARVRNSGYAPSTGTLTFDPTITAVVANDTIQLTGYFPFRDGLAAETSYLRLVNDALRLIDFKDRLTVPIVPGADAYDLASVAATLTSWLTPERLGWPQEPDPVTGRPRPPIMILEPHPISGRAPVPADWRRPQIRNDGASVTLEIAAPFALGTSGSITLNVMRPAFNVIGINGAALTESAIGLSNVTDLAQPSVPDVLAVMRWLAIRTLVARGASSASGRWTQADVTAAEREARAVPGFNAARAGLPPTQQEEAA